MIVLDTNVISELMRDEPATEVVSWVDQHPPDEVFVTAVTAAELLYGVARLPDGRRKTVLTHKARELLDDDFDGQVLAFDRHAASLYAQIVASRERGGSPISSPDAQIAAMCRAHDAGLATRNVKDFVDTGITIVDPWDTATERT